MTTAQDVTNFWLADLWEGFQNAVAADGIHGATDWLVNESGAGCDITPATVRRALQDRLGLALQQYVGDAERLGLYQDACRAQDALEGDLDALAWAVTEYAPVSNDFVHEVW